MKQLRIGEVAVATGLITQEEDRVTKRKLRRFHATTTRGGRPSGGSYGDVVEAGDEARRVWK